MVESLWGRTIQDGDRPEMTLKGETMRGGEDAGSGKMPEAIKVRPKEIAQKGASTTVPEYEILRLLGEGGMGMVYEARQTAIDRSIAVKMIKPDVAGDQEECRQFLAEAVATADLDHPNIVPIHDLGMNSEGALFYAMKQVKGTSWLDLMREKSVDENLDILMRVADAVAFAHNRGVIHRDLKPENVMLGDFGEVMLMDWGLAAAITDEAKADRLDPEHAIGGTPTYMAPEMAVGDSTKIGTCSDIYLLGAILYEIVTGVRVHTGTDVMDCLANAAENEIVATDEEGELIEVALKAMATEPSDRFESVKALQAAVREHQQHEESIVLAARAEEALAEAQNTQSYADFVDAVAGFKQAVVLWDGNERAAAGLDAARLAYAECAAAKRDYELAASLLEAEEPSHRQLLDRVEAAREERDARRRRMRVLKVTSAVSAAAALLVLGVAFFWIRAERNVAQQNLAAFKSEQAKRQADRKTSAPALVKSARILVEQADYDGALAMTETATDYDPELAQPYLLRALLLARIGDNQKAVEACTQCLEHDPEREEAKRLLQIIRERSEERAADVSLDDLAGISARMGVPTLAAGFYGSLKEQMRHFQQKIALALPGSGSELRADDEGRLRLTVKSAKTIADLARLRGLPLYGLNLEACPTDNLEPLRGMSLGVLNLSGTHVTDLSPLAGMPLVLLNLGGTAVSDLSPLRGMPLESLIIHGTPITDLSPLSGSPLRTLSIDKSRVSDLSPLKGMPLETLRLHKTRVHDLSPLTACGDSFTYLLLRE